MHSGLKSLVLTARRHGVDMSVDRLRHDNALGDADIDDRKLVELAREHGMKARAVRFRWDDLARLGDAYPVIARLNNGRFVIISGHRPGNGKVAEEHLLVVDPASSAPSIETVTRKQFTAHWSGQLILLRRPYGLADDDRPFSFNWVSGQFLKQKVLLAELVVIAFMLQVFALLPAVFVIIVLDKVVNYQSTSTLYVLTAGVLVAYLFNGLLGYLRQYIILFATSKVDVRLNALVFTKLLDLPLSYFQKRSIPAVAKNIQQTNTIRQVLTGKFFDAILDATSLLFFIPILFLYSPLLCAMVFGFAFMISLNVIIASRRQKGKLSAATTADAEKQSVLMSSIFGIETVKSLALEPDQERQWKSAVARQIVAQMELGKATAFQSHVSSTLEQLMTVAVIFVGVMLVFDGELTVGVLIGVNMLAGRVTGPLVQLVSLATEFERYSIAVKSLASVLNTSGESTRRGLATDIVGSIKFHGVSFAYEDGPKALDGVSFNIRHRQRVGIVGRAGAGKTTLARLIQGLIRPDEGTVTIDGQDVRNIDLGHLRINVAAVTQETTFFRTSIRDNIMKPYPNAPIARLLWASKMVGLHEDVDRLPDGYETMLNESASNLSAGQRKKVAMARALIRNPKVLILDEALCNFDLESEFAIRTQMPQINSGRTLILVTNRLSQVADCDLILVMDQGRLVQQGTHESLVRELGLYAELWAKEMALMDVGRLPGAAMAAE